jgi:hypothetical protein
VDHGAEGVERRVEREVGELDALRGPRPGEAVDAERDVGEPAADEEREIGDRRTQVGQPDTELGEIDHRHGPLAPRPGAAAGTSSHLLAQRAVHDQQAAVDAQPRHLAPLEKAREREVHAAGVDDEGRGAAGVAQAQVADVELLQPGSTCGVGPELPQVEGEVAREPGGRARGQHADGSGVRDEPADAPARFERGTLARSPRRGQWAGRRDGGSHQPDLLHAPGVQAGGAEPCDDGVERERRGRAARERGPDLARGDVLPARRRLARRPQVAQVRRQPERETRLRRRRVHGEATLAHHQPAERPGGVGGLALAAGKRWQRTGELDRWRHEAQFVDPVAIADARERALDRRGVHREQRRTAPRREPHVLHREPMYALGEARRVAEIAQVGDEAERGRGEVGARRNAHAAATRDEPADAPRRGAAAFAERRQRGGRRHQRLLEEYQVDVGAAQRPGGVAEDESLGGEDPLTGRGPHPDAAQRELVDALEARRPHLETKPGQQLRDEDGQQHGQAFGGELDRQARDAEHCHDVAADTDDRPDGPEQRSPHLRSLPGWIVPAKSLSGAGSSAADP